MELMCFCFKEKSSQRLKMCKFFQVVLTQLHLLTPDMGDTVACSIFSVADVAAGCSWPALLLIPCLFPNTCSGMAALGSGGDLDHWTGSGSSFKIPLLLSFPWLVHWLSSAHDVADSGVVAMKKVARDWKRSTAGHQGEGAVAQIDMSARDSYILKPQP